MEKFITRGIATTPEALIKYLLLIFFSLLYQVLITENSISRINHEGHK